MIETLLAKSKSTKVTEIAREPRKSFVMTGRSSGIWLLSVCTSHSSSESFKTLESSSSTLTEEHWEELRRIYSRSTHIVTIESELCITHIAHIAHISHISHIEPLSSHISIKIHLPTVIFLSFFRIRQDSMGFCHIFELFGSLFLLNITLSSVSVRVVFQS